MIFEPKCCLYVSSTPKPYIHEKMFLNFSKWQIFSNSLLFTGKTADFVTGFEKLFFHLKSLLTRMRINVNFVAQVFPELYAKNTRFKNN